MCKKNYAIAFLENNSIFLLMVSLWKTKSQ